MVVARHRGSGVEAHTEFLVVDKEKWDDAKSLGDDYVVAGPFITEGAAEAALQVTSLEKRYLRHLEHADDPDDLVHGLLSELGLEDFADALREKASVHWRVFRKP
jgi:hypothetical protein